MKQETCVLGAGRMSSSVVRSFLSNAYATSVWNRTHEKCAPVIAAGATSSNDLEDAVRQADVIVVNVLDFSTSDALFRRSSVVSRLPGKIVVQRNIKEHTNV
ncbi:MAG TPA: NAD(P)-binding domain-containing protein [Advenella sp.]|nr:NAD(P)-binding domain-containing protein [Advenella sp.]